MPITMANVRRTAAAATIRLELARRRFHFATILQIRQIDVFMIGGAAMALIRMRTNIRRRRRSFDKAMA